MDIESNQKLQFKQQFSNLFKTEVVSLGVEYQKLNYSRIRDIEKLSADQLLNFYLKRYFYRLDKPFPNSNKKQTAARLITKCFTFGYLPTMKYMCFYTLEKWLKLYSKEELTDLLRLGHQTRKNLDRILLVMEEALTYLNEDNGEEVLAFCRHFLGAQKFDYIINEMSEFSSITDTFFKY